LKGKGKLSHLDGTGAPKDDSRFAAWDEDDLAIMSWLWNSMQPEINCNYMFLSTTQEVWETVRKTYFKMQDVALMFEIKTRIASTKHASFYVTNYYNTLNALWLELDRYQNLKMKDSKNAQTLKEFIERDRVFEFLAGLNPEFNPV